MIYDVIIIGSGPAAYTASIYCMRYLLKTLQLEGTKDIGGQLMKTTNIENFPGFQSISGYELIERMKSQAESLGVETIQREATKIEKKGSRFIVSTSESKYVSRSVIISTGSSPRTLNFEGSSEFWQKGISTCAVCDGSLPIFRNKTIIVIGGGDSAAEEALYLSKFASKVYILVRSDRLRMSKLSEKHIKEVKKIKIVYHTEVVKVSGKITMTSATIINNITNKKKKISAAGIFYAIGHVPNSEFVKDFVDLDEDGYIKAVRHQTNVEGCFAAGDVIDRTYRQAITAAASGCEASLECIKYLNF